MLIKLYYDAELIYRVTELSEMCAKPISCSWRRYICVENWLIGADLVPNCSSTSDLCLTCMPIRMPVWGNQDTASLIKNAFYNQ